MFFYRWIAKYYDKEISATGLGIFRIAYATVVLLEVLQIAYFRTIIFQPLTPYTTPALFIWAGALVGLALGLFTRPCSIVNYGFAVVFIGSFTDFEYHFDFTMIGTNFLLIFLPISKALSLDNVIRRGRTSGPGTELRQTPGVSPLAYTVPLFVGIGLIYFDSVFHKLTSDSWIQGLGVWIPASLPHLTWNDLSAILDNRFIALFLGYFTLLFEATFVFGFWFRKLRVAFLLGGLGLHVGILLAFPIPFFALGYIAFYVLLVPVGWWRHLAPRSQARVSGEHLAMENDPRRNLKILAITGYLLIVGVFALATLYHSPLILRVRRDLRLDETRLGRRFAAATVNTEQFSRHYLGITPHGVFVDSHYRGYRHILALTHVEDDGSETWLPIIREDGHAHPLNSGRVWAKWSFRVNSPRLNRQQLTRGIRDFTRFWLAKNDKSSENAIFHVKLKEVEIPNAWREGFLRDQKAKPWRDIATVRWKSNHFYAQ